MKGKICCIANLKGGVGKTTTAIMLAEGLSAQNHRVLVIDTDAQANFGWSFLGKEGIERARDDGRTIDDFMASKFLLGKPVSIEHCIHGDVSNVYALGRLSNGRTSISLLPCTPGIIDLERRMLVALGKADCGYEKAEMLIYHSFMSVVAHARESYDWVVIDCAPGLNILTRSALGAADAVVVATVPEPLPAFGLDTFLDVIWANHSPDSGFPKPVAPNVLITRYDKSDREHREIEGRIRNPAPGSQPYTVMRTVIPEATDLKSASFFGRAWRGFADKYVGGTGRLAMRLAAEVSEAA